MPYPIYVRASYSGLLDDDYDWVRVAAREGDSRELHGGIMCMMYFDAALSQEELSAAFSLCLPIGEQLHKPLGVPWCVRFTVFIGSEYCLYFF